MSQLDRLTNRALIFQFAIAFISVFFSTAYSTIWTHLKGSEHWYLELKTSITMVLFDSLGTFIILYSLIIPISLYVTIELARLVLSYYVNNDIEMMDSKNKIQAKVKTSSLMEELGQISYIFADKTGTLTVNEMNFKKCTISGEIYGNSDDGSEVESEEVSGEKYNFRDDRLSQEIESNKNPEIREFMRAMSVCHSVLPEKSRGKEEESKTKHKKYQATSPDEKALVVAAQHLGYIFEKRIQDSVVVKIKENEFTFKILATLEFSSDRRRMSIICETPEGEIVLYMKGADSVVWERLREDQREKWATTGSHLQKFAQEGLRTLVFASKKLSQKEFDDWFGKFQKVSLEIEDRDQKIGEVSEEIERDLEILGGVGIEDKLQKGVPEALEKLSLAGINIWILTVTMSKGDKRETAMNVGYSCRLLRSETMIINIESNSPEQLIQQLNIGLEELNKQEKVPFVMLIDGRSLSIALSDPVKLKFLEVTDRCQSVILCRISPIQKSTVVTTIKEHSHKRVLSIGDGANDVPMIQEAHVGIGILGKEGSQAARSADFSISQFRFLEKLLLVHGHWNYVRMSKLILYSFYKNVTFCLIQLWFNTVMSVSSGQTLFDSFSLALFNSLFTFLPIQAYATIEQEVPMETIEEFPQIYKRGMNNKEFNMRLFFAWILDGIWQSAVISFGLFFLFSDGGIDMTGRTYGLWTLGVIAYSSVVMTVTAKIISETRYWTWINVIVIVLSVSVWFIWLSIISGIMFPNIEYMSSGGSNMYWVGFQSMSTVTFWLSILLLPVGALWPHFTYKQIRRMFKPTTIEILQELEKISDNRKYRAIV